MCLMIEKLNKNNKAVLVETVELIQQMCEVYNGRNNYNTVIDCTE